MRSPEPAADRSFFTADARLEPWWWEAAPPRAPAATALPGKADVAIVGAGYTGVAAALTLARAGRRVLVLDAGPPGAGASTRNGGMIGSGHRLSFATLAGRLGRARAVAIMSEGLHALAFTAGLIEGERIECHFTRCGRYRAAWRPRDYDAIGREVDALRREIGLEADMVPRAEQDAHVRTAFYHGGCLYHRHGGLHPALFHAGLLACAEAAGASVIDNTAVTGLAREGPGFTVATGRGRFAARDVIGATNGYSGPGLRAFQRRVMPIGSYIIATERLAPEAVSALIPGGRMIVETRARHCYYRASPDGRRILFGGRASLRPIDPERGGRRLRRLMVQLFPDLSGVRVTHAWTGLVAFARDGMPHLGVIDGIHYAMGYCGSGVAMAPYLGHKIALRVLGRPEAASAFDAVPFRPIPFNAGRALMLAGLDLYYGWRDRIEGSA